MMEIGYRAVSDFEAALSRNFRKTVRIIGENEKAGSFSSMWSFKGGNDGFYFSARSAFNYFKVSLHANNHRGYLAHSKHVDDGVARPRHGIFDWKLPTPGSIGAVQAASIKLPADFMFADVHPYISQNKALVFSVQPTCALEIGIFLAHERKDTLEEKFARIGLPLFEVSVESWLNVFIVVRSVGFDPASLPTQQQMNGAIYTPLAGQLAEANNLNMMVFNKPADGEVIQIIDIGSVSLRRVARSAQ